MGSSNPSESDREPEARWVSRAGRGCTADTSSRALAGDPARPVADAPGVAATRDVRGALELFGLVIAPTTIITALAFYFGWTLTNARASYFGIDASALGFSTQDYLLRSADALFVPRARC